MALRLRDEDHRPIRITVTKEGFKMAVALYLAGEFEKEGIQPPAWLPDVACRVAELEQQLEDPKNASFEEMESILDNVAQEFVPEWPDR